MSQPPVPPIPVLSSPSPAAGRLITASSVFLPKEHGSWSLALEPLALGLLIAPSPAGAALALAGLAGFFARRPLKAVLTQTPPARRRSAWLALVTLSGLALAGFAAALLLGDPRALWPLLLAAPFGGLFLCFDAQGESRAAAAELAGSAAFALLPAAFASLAGWAVPVALALAAVAMVRSVPTVLTVRTYLRLSKGQPVNPLFPLLAATAGLAAVILLAAGRLLPWGAAAGAVLLWVRTGWLTGARRPGWTTRRIGIGEAFLGVGYVLIATVAYRA